MKNEHKNNIITKSNAGTTPIEPKRTSSQDAYEREMRVKSWENNHRPVITSQKRIGS